MKQKAALETDLMKLLHYCKHHEACEKQKNEAIKQIAVDKQAINYCPVSCVGNWHASHHRSRAGSHLWLVDAVTWQRNGHGI